MCDYIDRADAIKSVCEDCEYYSTNDCFDCRLTRLEAIPAADVRPMTHGQWRKSGFSLRGVPIFSCSFCKESLETSPEFVMKTTYCPFCGADMTGGADG